MENESLLDMIDKKFVNPLKELKSQVKNNSTYIIQFFSNEVVNADNKEKMLLNFRRGIEMLIKVPLIVTTISKSTNKIIVVRSDNLSQLLDDRYYTEFQLSSFLDIFKIETNNFKKMNMDNKEPHIGLIINYILIHYNTTFRKFMNRNTQYYYMYKFFFDKGTDIKYILEELNSYHYNIETKEVYENLKIENIKNDTYIIYEEIILLLKKLPDKISI